MITPSQQLDRRFDNLRPLLARAERPAQGWLKAIREALGMTTRQMARRMQFTQSRVSKMERAETHGQITLHSLQRAAEALGCEVVYVVIPKRPLTETLEHQARLVAEKQIQTVEQTMRLEAQEVRNPKQRPALLQQATNRLLRRPARLWDEA